MLSRSCHKSMGDTFSNAHTVHSLTTWNPTTSTGHHSSIQPMEQMLQSRCFPKNVRCSILFYSSRMTGQSTLASSHANQFLPCGIQRPLQKTFSPPACTQPRSELSLNLSGFSAALTSEAKGHYSAAAHPKQPM